MIPDIDPRHAWEDDYAPWRYDKTCGCTTCLAWEDETQDLEEADFWEATGGSPAPPPRHQEAA